MTVDRVAEEPTLTFRYHDDTGKIGHVDKLNLGSDGKLE